MAMFSNNPREGATPGAAETFIGPSVKMEGNFSGEGDVVIEGILVGTVSTKGDVKIGQNAVIEAEIRAKNAYIAGKIKGNLVVSNLLKLASTAVIIGDVKTVALGIEEGAILNGKLMMTRDKSIREQNTPERHAPAEDSEKVKVAQ
jgi:cytoskeletal protein CcmA (bactofilin family)